METKMLYRIMETVSTFYACHKDEISKEYTQDLDEQTKAILALIKEQNGDDKNAWVEYTHTDYYRRYFKEQEVKKEITKLSDDKLIEIWEQTESDEEAISLRGWIIDEVAKRFPREVDAWMHCEEQEDSELRYYVFHTRKKNRTLQVIG